MERARGAGGREMEELNHLPVDFVFSLAPKVGSGSSGSSKPLEGLEGSKYVKVFGNSIMSISLGRAMLCEENLVDGMPTKTAFAG